MLCSILYVLKLPKYNLSSEVNVNWTPFPLCPLGLCYHCFRSTSASMFVSHDFAFMLFLRVKTAQHCVPLVYTDQAACPPAPAIITHPALRSTAPASAERVKNIRSRLDFSFDCSVCQVTFLDEQKTLIYACIIWISYETQCIKAPNVFNIISVSVSPLHGFSSHCQINLSPKVFPFSSLTGNNC